MGIENAGRLPAAAAFHNMAVYYPPRPAIVAEDRPATQVLAVKEQVEAIMGHRFGVRLCLRRGLGFGAIRLDHAFFRVDPEGSGGPKCDRQNQGQSNRDRRPEPKMKSLGPEWPFPFLRDR